MPVPIFNSGNLLLVRRATMAQETHNGEHDHSAVRVAVWYDYI